MSFFKNLITLALILVAAPLLSARADECVNPALREAVTPRQVSQLLDETEANRVLPELLAIAALIPNRPKNQTLTGSEFNLILSQLTQFARSRGIEILPTKELLGVYPNGLYELKVSGLASVGESNKPVGFAKQHELAHLFHTILVRANLIAQISGKTLDAETRVNETELTWYVGKLEDDFNYLEFEKAVTAAASLAHVVTGSVTNPGRYRARIEALLTATQKGIYAGKIRFLTEWGSIEGLYGLFLSRVPIVMGKSGKQAALRMPFLMFATLYALNPPVSGYGIDPERFGIKKSANMGFRDFIHALALKPFKKD